MAKRTYKQNCALAQASDVIGERWSLLLIRDLLVGPRRFGELQQSLKGIGANLLAARLRDLEATGVVERTTGDAHRQHYQLTVAGRALEAAVLSLIRWGLTYGPKNRKGYYHQDDWDLLALKSLFDSKLAEDLSVCVQFRTDEFSGWVSINKQDISVGLGEAESFDVVVNGTIKDLFFTPSVDELVETGSATKLRRFRSSFSLPKRQEQAAA